MTLAARIRSKPAESGRRGGFTLLECVLAMSLMMMIIGIGLIFYFNAGDKEILRRGAISIESMSSRAHAMSVMHQKPFWIRFEDDKVVLVGADIRSKPEIEPGGPPAWLEDGEEEETNETVYETWEGEAIVSIRRWGTRDNAWIRPEKGEFHIWHFQSTGLCEPISIKLETEKSWLILHMNPLTARIDDEEMEIQ